MCALMAIFLATIGVMYLIYETLWGMGALGAIIGVSLGYLLAVCAAPWIERNL